MIGTLHVYDGPIGDTITRRSDGGLFDFHADASDIGLPVGFWPERLVVTSWIEFRKHEDRIDGDGEGWVEYRSFGGVTLRVYND